MTARRFAFGMLALAIVCGAALILHRALHAITLAELAAAIRDTPAANILGCLCATAISFACLGYYDRFATDVSRQDTYRPATRSSSAWSRTPLPIRSDSTSSPAAHCAIACTAKSDSAPWTSPV